MTSHTLRFAAGLLDAMRSVTRGVPEMCTVSVSTGDAKSSRWFELAALASALPLKLTSSTSVLVPLGGADNASAPIAVPLRVGKNCTGVDPGTGNDANGVGGPAG